MVKIGYRNIAIIFILAWLVLSPYALTASNLNKTNNPTIIMTLAAPTISGPSTYEFENGTLGHTLVYTASDPHPKNYTVTVDGDELDNGIWTGGKITVYLVLLYHDGRINTLPQTLTMVCTVFNDEGESASATTIITVILDETAPIIAQDSITVMRSKASTNAKMAIPARSPAAAIIERGLLISFFLLK